MVSTPSTFMWVLGSYVVPCVCVASIVCRVISSTSVLLQYTIFCCFLNQPNEKSITQRYPVSLGNNGEKLAKNGSIWRWIIIAYRLSFLQCSLTAHWKNVSDCQKGSDNLLSLQMHNYLSGILISMVYNLVNEGAF